MAKRETDRDLLLSGLASVKGAVALDTWEKTLVLGNLHLFFDGGGKLNCLRILESDGKDRMYVVQEPQEILNDDSQRTINSWRTLQAVSLKRLSPANYSLDIGVLNDGKVEVMFKLTYSQAESLAVC
jgi:hypothetical protein